MHYTKPSYYDNFICIAGACPATCCGGWQIIIDDASLDKYSDISGPLGDRVRSSITYNEDGEPYWRLSEDGKCRLLTCDGLCPLQKELGEEYLCHTCDVYPRHIEEYDGEQEYSLSPSCPEAARIILKTAIDDLIEWGDELEDDYDYEDYDYFLYTGLVDARKAMFDLIRSDLTYDKIMALVLEYSFMLQDCIDEDRICDMADISPASVASVSPDDYFNYDLEKRLFSKLFELEILQESWPALLSATYELVFSSEESYKRCNKLLGQYDSYIKRILYFMIYVYFDGAIYDDLIYTKAALCVYCTRWIFMVFLQLKQADSPEYDDSDEYANSAEHENTAMTAMVKAVYTFCREIEHSDLNIEALEEWF